jgi:hypothetical protein
MTNENVPQAEFLRHVVATIAYRGGKFIRDAPAGFAELEISPGSRTPLQILAHIGDVLSWALSIVEGDQAWSGSTAESWNTEAKRFFNLLIQLDRALKVATDENLPATQLFQGPFADTLTHIGQLAMLRRIAGAPVRGENYFKARVVRGNVGPEQVSPKYEFD